MTPRDFVLQRIFNIVNEKCSHAIYFNEQTRKIYYAIKNTCLEITEPLEILYQFFADIEDEHWREKLCEKYAVPMDMMFPRVRQEGKYTFVIDKKTKVYISGKITGLSEKVYKNNFNSAESYLSGLGYDVINPVSYTPIENGTWEDYMKRDLKLLLGCDYIYLLEGWQDSDGASLEYTVAKTLGIKVLKLDI